MRLEAARAAGFEHVPVLVHFGCTEEEMARLLDVDNENDEYHRPVPVVDVWAEYARLYEKEGWAQEKIAQVKGLKSHVMVSYRLKLYRLPGQVKDFVTQGLLSETHLRKIVDLLLELHFAPWFTSEQAMLELAEKTVKDIKKNRQKSVCALEADVASWKEWMAPARELHYGARKSSQAERNLARIEEFVGTSQCWLVMSAQPVKVKNQLRKNGQPFRRTIFGLRPLHDDAILLLSAATIGAGVCFIIILNRCVLNPQ